MNKTHSILIACLGLFFCTNIAAEPIKVNPGGVLFIDYTKPLAPTDSVKLGQTKVVILKNGNRTQFVAGVDVNTVYGDYLLTVESKKEQLDKVQYAVNKVKSAFSDNTLSLLENSKDVTKKLLWSNRSPKLPLSHPTTGNWSNDFGNFTETYPKAKNNKQFKQKTLQHIDYLSTSFSTATSITSPGDAICFSVKLIKDQGYTILLDHGMGLFSEIAGLEHVLISEQDLVPKGSLLANYTQASFINKEKPTAAIKEETIQWRTFLTKATINPNLLTVNSALNSKISTIRNLSLESTVAVSSTASDNLFDR